MHPPETKVVCMGILINTIQRTITIPVDKLDQTMQVCEDGRINEFNNMVYFIPIPKGYMGYNIAHLEMINVVMALKVWGQCWANKRINIHCDNKVVVDIFTYGRARDTLMATSAHNIWLLTALYNISLLVVHIEGHNNSIADLLSRWTYIEGNIKTLQNFIPDPI